MVKRNLRKIKVKLYNSNLTTEYRLPLYPSVRAGFPSPASDFLEQDIDLNKTLIRHPSATFFARVDGNSMKNAGIDDGDLLVVDRSLHYKDNAIVVCYIDGEFTVKRLKLGEKCHYLVAENEDYSPIIVTKENHFIVWGVVASVIKMFV